jgi:L-rhamnose mutarotase
MDVFLRVQAVWPEMQEALVECGWHNYSLFYRPDGFAVGYFETKDADFDIVCERMESTEVNAKWQAAMQKYTPENVVPIDAAVQLEPYFYVGVDRQEVPGADYFSAEAKEWSPQAWTGGGEKSADGQKKCMFQMRFEAKDLAGYLKDHETCGARVRGGGVPQFVHLLCGLKPAYMRTNAIACLSGSITAEGC